MEQAFKEFSQRDDIAIILISQPVANMIRHIVDAHRKVGMLLLLCKGDKLFFLTHAPFSFFILVIKCTLRAGLKAGLVACLKEVVPR